MRATWRLPDGSTQTADVDAGTTLMEAAKANGIPNFGETCGGRLDCTACHVVVDDGWLAKLQPVHAFEDAMLDQTTARQEASRMSCQIRMSAALDGITVSVPKA
ncbi:2Fe-2S iron-sulfur cluster-binding protein [uncultured Sulfitobacter sp.]|uniref:2Fe-2S iron-sulfur cluster-binding protein n=1 Tax=uncultured Sulfitobacter sp. TaxID=191468 RepID=UPI0026298AD2|nr:2Fe-2S iron-sulfur cluster-binding protein [uncultured Sulfitobacter sp.]